MGLFAVALRDRAHRLPQAHLAGLLLSPATADGPTFRARIDTSAPAGAGDIQVRGPSGGGAEDAPRAAAHDQLVWEATALDGSAVDLVSGDRLLIAPAGEDAGAWELTRPPTPHRLFQGPIVYTGEAIRVSSLYPLTAVLRELGGAPVPGAGALPLGLWQVAQSPQEGGEQYVYTAETPYASLPHVDTAVRANRELVVDGLAYRVTEALPHRSAPRVVLTLRRVRGGG